MSHKRLTVNPKPSRYGNTVVRHDLLFKTKEVSKQNMDLDIGCRYAKIDGFNDYYITEHGDVYSVRTYKRSDRYKLYKMKPKNPGKENKYYNIILSDKKHRFTKSIHRLVAEYFVDGYFDGAVVNHKDGNNRNNDYSNLEWVTQKENIHKSYHTSGVDQTRNYLWWNLISPDGSTVGRFKGHQELESYVREAGIKASPSSLTKYGKCNGYTITKDRK